MCIFSTECLLYASLPVCTCLFPFYMHEVQFFIMLTGIMNKAMVLRFMHSINPQVTWSIFFWKTEYKPLMTDLIKYWYFCIYQSREKAGYRVHIYKYLYMYLLIHFYIFNLLWCDVAIQESSTWTEKGLCLLCIKYIKSKRKEPNIYLHINTHA